MAELPGHIVEALHNPPRLDREDTYIGVLASLFMGGLGIYLLPIGVGTVGTLDPTTQQLLAVCMMVGAALALSGAAMGTRTKVRVLAPIRWVMLRLLPHHKPVPLWHCYRLGYAGLFATCISLGVFSWVLLTHGTVVGSFTGLMSPILFVCWTRKGLALYREAARMERDYRYLTGPSR